MSELKVESLSCYRASRAAIRKRDRHSKDQEAILFVPDVFPGAQKLERARIVNELAQALGVELTLVAAVAAGRFRER